MDKLDIEFVIVVVVVVKEGVEEYKVKNIKK